MVKKLVANGANIYAANKFNKTALIYALEEGILLNIVIVMWNNCAIEITCINQWHIGHESIVRLLVENGADISDAVRSSAVNGGMFKMHQINAVFKPFFLIVFLFISFINS